MQSILMTRKREHKAINNPRLKRGYENFIQVNMMPEHESYVNYARSHKKQKKFRLLQRNTLPLPGYLFKELNKPFNFFIFQVILMLFPPMKICILLLERKSKTNTGCKSHLRFFRLQGEVALQSKGIETLRKLPSLNIHETLWQSLPVPETFSAGTEAPPQPQ